jgi:predicted aspartyl protease
MTITFHYKRVSRPGGEIKSPTIPVVLAGKATKFEFAALLDSGADVSAIPKSVAELLGLDLNGKQEEAEGIGGKVPAVQSKMRLSIEKHHEQYSFDIPVKVILTSQDFTILLGRAGFFDKFVVTFDQANEKVMLKRVTSK